MLGESHYTLGYQTRTLYNKIKNSTGKKHCSVPFSEVLLQKLELRIRGYQIYRCMQDSNGIIGFQKRKNNGPNVKNPQLTEEPNARHT